MIDDLLLSEYASGFLGYGNPQADLWFVGMEEAGAWSAAEIGERIGAWADLGRQPIIDCAEFHRRVRDAKRRPLSYWFEPGAPLQPTWRRLIRLMLARDGRATDRESVRHAQIHDWGRPSSGACFIELFPLPAPKTGEWPYAAWTRAAHLQTRTAYRASYLSERIGTLRALIARHTPRVVVLYGSGYMEHWAALADSDFQPHSVIHCHSGRGDAMAAHYVDQRGTLWVAACHPNFRGPTDHYFAIVGAEICRRVAGPSTPPFQ
jgi:hypothetical protein